jgi:hypothetical protein
MSQDRAILDAVIEFIREAEGALFMSRGGPLENLLSYREMRRVVRDQAPDALEPLTPLPHELGELLLRVSTPPEPPQP